MAIPIFHGWWIVASFFMLAMIASGTVYSGFTVFIDPIVAEFAWSYTTVSLVAAMRGLNTGILSPLTGYLTDRFGPRLITFFSLAILSAGLIMAGLARHPGYFVTAMLIISCGAGGMTSVVFMKAVAQWFDRHVGKAMGITSCGFGAGGLLVYLTAWLVDAYGWRTAMLANGAGVLLAGLPLACLIRNSPREMGLLPDGGGPKVKQGADSKPEGRNILFKHAVRGRNYWLLTISESLRHCVLAGLLLHIMPFLGSLGYDRITAGLAATALSLSSIAGYALLGWAGDSFNKKWVSVSAYGLMLAGLTGMLFAANPWLLTLAIMFFGPGFGGVTTLRSALLKQMYGTRAFGRLMGVIIAVSACFSLAGPVLAGASFDYYGGYSPALYAYLVIQGVATILAALINTGPHIQTKRFGKRSA
jgi:MFS family permease